MHPWERLQRKSPGASVTEPRDLERRICARDQEPPPPRAVPGEKTVVREAKLRSNRIKADPRPNAPLLMRLVRWPFALHVAQGKRAEWRGAVPWELLERVLSQSPRVLLAPDREIVGFRPMHDIDRRWTRQPRPSVDAWLSSAGGAR